MQIYFIFLEYHLVEDNLLYAINTSVAHSKIAHFDPTCSHFGNIEFVEETVKIKQSGDTAKLAVSMKII